ncbi:hypothetical protein WJX81_005762 [Elliptochloris bilobata]|uniref:Kinesin motor domain-containing protein n=1 Tax=Elliptochloris bilobata TaxID=381761 RepID=A0AAW1SD39_9CHLO
MTGTDAARQPALTVASTRRTLTLCKHIQGAAIAEREFGTEVFDEVYVGTQRRPLYSEATGLVGVVLRGTSAAVVAYGQTGSGKTYQMQGNPARREDWGIVPFVTAELLARVGATADSGRSYLITLSAVELYGDHVHDLLAGTGAAASKLDLRLNADGAYDVVGAREAPITCVAQALGLLDAACRQARTGAHKMNARSSRSFVDFILKVESLGEGTPGGTASVARLHLVDLAGSERQARTGAAGERLREAGAINSALTVLRRVVAARCERARRAAHSVPPGGVESRPPLVPYNESNLTRLLKDALAGDARLLVLACLSAAPADHDATLDTLTFAQGCRSLTAAPKVRYVRGGQIAGVVKDLQGMAAAAAAASELSAHHARLARELQDKEAQLETQRRVVDYLETELAVERTLAQGRAARAANIALTLQRSVAGLAGTACDLMRAYVAGGPGAEVVGGLLAESQLPQLRAVLEAEPLAAQLDVHALLRLLKAFLQVNYTRSGELVRAARPVFALLRTERAARAWADALPFCLAQLAGAAAGAAPLPAYGQDNMLNLLSGILKALDAGTLAALQPAAALDAAREFLAAALDPPIAATPAFQEVADGVQHFKELLAAAEESARALPLRTTRSGRAYSTAGAASGGGSRRTGTAACNGPMGGSGMRTSRSPAGSAPASDADEDVSPKLLALEACDAASGAWLTGGAPAGEAAAWLAQRSEEQAALASGRKPVGALGRLHVLEMGEAVMPASASARQPVRSVLSPLQPASAGLTPGGVTLMEASSIQPQSNASSQTSAGNSSSLAASGFIRAYGTYFVDSQCHNFVLVCLRSWVNLDRQAAAAADGLPAGSPLTQSNGVTSIMDQAVAAGFNIVRIFAHGEDPRVNSEYFFKGLDYVLAVAGSRKIKALIVPFNNWLEPQVGDGRQRYLNWTNTPTDANDTLWINSNFNSMIMNHYNALVHRRNVFTGKAYRDDDTIFAWNLVNEFRCPAKQNSTSWCVPRMTSWINQMASYIRSIDPNHMVTVGEEGFFDANGPRADLNPWGLPNNVQVLGSRWAGGIGQDFVQQHSGGDISFAAFHMWPDNWFTQDVRFPSTWINAHISAVGELGKPLLLEEFGKSSGAGNKEGVYEDVYGALEKSLASNGPLRGALFWRWSLDGGDDTAVNVGDSVWGIIQKHLVNIKKYMGQPVPGCSPTAASS